MTEYIDRVEVMRRFKPFGREIPKEQVMAVLARVDEGIVRCKDCKWRGHIGCAVQIVDESDRPNDEDFCSYGERKGGEDE